MSSAAAAAAPFGLEKDARDPSALGAAQTRRKRYVHATSDRLRKRRAGSRAIADGGVCDQRVAAAAPRALHQPRSQLLGHDQVPHAGRVRDPGARGRRARPQLLAARVRQLQHADQPDERPHLLQVEERDPPVEHDRRAAAQPLLAGQLGGRRRRVVEEAQAALPQVRQPRGHDGEGVRERQDPVQRQAGGDPDAREPVAAHLDLRVPVVAARLLVLDRAHPDARVAADAQGRAADPSGAYSDHGDTIVRGPNPRVQQAAQAAQHEAADGEGSPDFAPHRRRPRFRDERCEHFDGGGARRALLSEPDPAEEPSVGDAALELARQVGGARGPAAGHLVAYDGATALSKRDRAGERALVESLVNFSISALKEGHELANFMKSIWQLGIGRPSILEPIAKQVLFVLNSETEVHDINEHEASIIATSIVHLSSKEVREQPWVKQLLHAAANRLVEESTRKGKTSNFDILIPLVRAFVIAGEFHEELFTLLFAEVRKDRLDQADYMSPFKIRNLKSKMYQVHLDCVLNGYSKELRLKPAQVEEFKEIFQSHQVQVKSSSFRLQHLVSTALDEMGVEHTRSLALDEGYCLDIALKHKIAIEINDAECYQVLEDHEPESEADKKDFIIATSMDEKPFGFVDLKARHLEELGWVVIQLRADKYQKLSSVEDRVRYLSMLLEVANNARRQQHQSELASFSSSSD